MKVRNLILALIVGTLALTSCKKEEEIDPSENYDITVVKTSDFTDGTKEFTLFEDEDVSISVRKNSMNNSVYIKSVSSCSISATKRNEDGGFDHWEPGDEVINAKELNWCHNMVFLTNNSPTSFCPYKIFISDGVRYGWIKVTWDKIEIAFPKNNSLDYRLGF